MDLEMPDGMSSSVGTVPAYSVDEKDRVAIRVFRSFDGTDLAIVVGSHTILLDRRAARVLSKMLTEGARR